jgi:hypothetical protein
MTMSENEQPTNEPDAAKAAQETLEQLTETVYHHINARA